MKTKVKLLLFLAATLLFTMVVFPQTAKAATTEPEISILKDGIPATHGVDYEYTNAYRTLTILGNDLVLSTNSETTELSELFTIEVGGDCRKLTLKNFKLICPRCDKSIFSIMNINDQDFQIYIEGDCEVGFVIPTSGAGTEYISCIDYNYGYTSKADLIISGAEGAKLNFANANITNDYEVNAITSNQAVVIDGDVCLSGRGRVDAFGQITIKDSASIYNSNTYPNMPLSAGNGVEISTSKDVFISGAEVPAVCTEVGNVDISNMTGNLYLSAGLDDPDSGALMLSSVGNLVTGGRLVAGSDVYGAEFSKITKELNVKEGRAYVKDTAGNSVPAKTIFSHVHKYEKQTGKTPTYDEPGYKDYYKCKYCGILAEDESGDVKIEDFDAWKSKGGNGYLDRLKYVVTFDTDGGTAVESQKLYKNEAVVRPKAPVKEGFTFLTWITDKGDIYDFTKPVTADITIYAKWQEDEIKLPFVDVKKTDYFYDAVRWAFFGGVTSGTDATHFSPYSSATRAHVVTFIWRAVGEPEPKGDASNFTDVNKHAYYAKAVAWAYEQGITSGTTKTTFSPNAVCTRAQTITLLANYAGVKKAKVETGFSDVKSTDYYAAAVKWAKDNEIAAGTTSTTFSPNDICTRAQALCFVYRYFDKFLN